MKLKTVQAVCWASQMNWQWPSMTSLNPAHRLSRNRLWSYQSWQRFAAQTVCSFTRFLAKDSLWHKMAQAASAGHTALFRGRVSVCPSLAIWWCIAWAVSEPSRRISNYCTIFECICIAYWQVANAKWKIMHYYVILRHWDALNVIIILYWIVLVLFQHQTFPCSSVKYIQILSFHPHPSRVSVNPLGGLEVWHPLQLKSFARERSPQAWWAPPFLPEDSLTAWHSVLFSEFSVSFHICHLRQVISCLQSLCCQDRIIKLGQLGLLLFPWCTTEITNSSRASVLCSIS